MIVKVISNGITREIEAEENTSLLKLLQRNGYEVAANCGGFGKCGKCAVKLTKNGVTEKVKACSVTAENGMTVEIGNPSAAFKADVLPPMETDGAEGVGLALDIGTTTLAFYFVSLKTGKAISVFSALNPQCSFGADVISRISHADENGVGEMNKCLKTRINEVISDFFKRFSFDKLSVIFVTGNTIMLHIFAGEEISSFGRYPFKPVFSDKREFSGEALGYAADKVVCLPSFDSFVGADIVCGAIAADITGKDSILVDLGTNGEILMDCGGKTYVTSVAAGPAFEGADIECGTGGVSGAISSVKKNGGGIEIKTIGGVSASGICGAGLTDAVALMADNGIIDETGAFLRDSGHFYLAEGIYVSDKDVRKFQLAKSAIRSGIDIMCGIAGREGVRIRNIYICGGLGTHIDVSSAFRVGLIPPAFKGRVISLGNAAGIGAAMCMLSEKTLEKAENTAKNKITVELASNVEFMNLFMENMAI